MSLALRSDDISGTRGHSRFDLLGAVLVISKTDRQRDRLEEFPPRSKSGKLEWAVIIPGGSGGTHRAG
jgi:hypothetical protein